MMTVRGCTIISICFALGAGSALAQADTNLSAVTATNATPAILDEADAAPWSFSASAYTYIVPDSREFVQPSFTADRGWLHLEARYNYEDLETGSAWVGYNFSVGEKLAFEATPMLGGVFGNTTGLAPGYKFSLTYWKLELYSESEYVVDLGDSAGNFFYTWSELTLAPAEWFRFGLVAQRTRAYQTDLDVQRGLLAGFSYRKFDFTTYAFNLDQNTPTVVLAVGLNF